MWMLMKKQGLFEWIRNTSFITFFAYWLVSIVIFGVIYWLFSLITQGLALDAELLTFSLAAIFKFLYASFLSATLFGISRLAFSNVFTVLIYIQFVFTIVIIFILVDKILQKWVTPHYHGIHDQDRKIHTVMLMMSIFHNDVDRIRHAFRSKARTHISTKEIEAVIDGLYVAFLDVEHLVSARNEHRHRIKNIQYLMIIENIQDSLEKLEKFIEFLDAHHMEWKDKHVEFWLHYILETAEKITVHADDAQIDSPKIIVALHNTRDYAQQIRQKLR